MPDYRIQVSDADNSDRMEIDTLVRGVENVAEALDEALIRIPETRLQVSALNNDNCFDNNRFIMERNAAPNVFPARLSEGNPMFRALILWWLGVPLGLVLLIWFFVF